MMAERRRDREEETVDGDGNEGRMGDKISMEDEAQEQGGHDGASAIGKGVQLPNYGLFWRDDLNWKFNAWEWRPLRGSKDGNGKQSESTDVEMALHDIGHRVQV